MSDAPWILVADDDDDIREAVTMLLQMEGYNVVGAVDGQDALETIRSRGRPSLILLDLRMPRLHGADLVRLLRQEPALASIPVVVLSGDATVAESAVALGARGWLKKPFELDQLFGAVRGVVPPPQRAGMACEG